MALTPDEKLLVAEYVTAGLIIREVADRLLSGRVTKAEMSMFRSLVRFAGRSAVRGVGTVASAARTHPLITAGTIAYIAHTRGVTLDTAMEIARNEVEMMQYHQRRVSPLLAPVQIASGIERMAPSIDPKLAIGPYSIDVKRKVTRANKAVKQGMKWLKEGTKAATGSVPGVLPAKAFRTTVKAAGMANPKTKSKPGKGKSIMNKLARRLKKWW